MYKIQKSLATVQEFSKTGQIGRQKVGYAATAVSFVLLTISAALLSSNFVLYNALSFDMIKNVVRIIAAAIMIVGLILDALSIKYMRTELLILSLLSMSILLNGESSLNLMLAMLFSVLARRHGEKRTVRMLCGCSIILVLAVVLMLSIGVTSDYSYVSTLGRYRRTLGFKNPNQTSLFFLALLALPIISTDINKKKTVFLVSIPLVYVARQTNSRGLIVSCISYLILLMLFALSKTNGKMIKRMVLTILYVSIAITLIQPHLANTNLDIMLSYRPTIFRRFFEEASLIELFLGKQIDYSLDNFYMVSIANYGIVITMVLIMTIQKALISISYKRDIYTLAFMCSLLTYAMIESFLFRPELIVTLIFWTIVVCNSTSSIFESEGTNK